MSIFWDGMKVIKRASCALLLVVWFSSGCLSSHKVQSNGQSKPTREELHSQIVAGKGLHGAFIALADVGDSSSIPILIVALESAKRRGEFSYDHYRCTWTHCIDALRSITGKDFGDNPDSWIEWWRNVSPQSPSRPTP